MALVADFNSSVNVPFQRMRALLGEAGGGLQAGVIGATDLKVSQRAAGANMSVDVAVGAAWVAITTGTRNGLGHVYSDAIANVTVTASNATNPRIDSILLRWNDSSIPTGSGNVPTLEVATGTATAGATLDNRTGAATPTGDFLRIADILVPAASTSVTTANIRDRRPWARGAYFRVVRNANAAGGTGYTTTSTTPVALDGTNLAPRIECSGVPLRLTIRAEVSHSVANTAVYFQPRLDGTTVDGTGATSAVVASISPVAASPISPMLTYDFLPTAGSHIVEWWWLVGAAGTATVSVSANNPLVFTVEEIVRPNASNT